MCLTDSGVGWVSAWRVIRNTAAENFSDNLSFSVCVRSAVTGSIARHNAKQGIADALHGARWSAPSPAQRAAQAASL